MALVRKPNALFESDANSYLTKPVTVQKIGDELRNLKLIS